MNCCVVPCEIKVFGGAMLIDTNGGVTIRALEPVTLPRLAVIVVLPLLKALAEPIELMVATKSDEEFHVTDEVKSSVPPSANVPVAWNCTDDPMSVVRLVGAIVMEVSVEGLTVTMVEPQTEPAQAFSATEPVATAKA